VNLDGAFHAYTGGAGWGCVARDHDNHPFFAGAGTVANAGEALQAETCVLLQAISIIELMRIGRPFFSLIFRPFSKIAQ
jgi:hypothetical protein